MGGGVGRGQPVRNNESMGTEARNPRSIGLDKMTPQEIVRLMNEEEHQVIRAMKAAEPQLAEAITQCAEVYKGGGRIVYVGAGTSGRVARMDAAEMPPTFGIDNTRFIALTAGGDEAASNAIEDAEDEVHSAMEGINQLGIGPGDALIALAASGRTPYVVAAAKHAGAKGVWTCGIANNPGAPLFDHVDLAILLETGPEVLTGSTRLKAGTSQKLALNAISTGTRVLAGKVVENLMIDVKAKNQKLKERCVRIVRELTNATEVDALRLLEANDWNVRRVVEMLHADERD